MSWKQVTSFSSVTLLLLLLLFTMQQEFCNIWTRYRLLFHSCVFTFPNRVYILKKRNGPPQFISFHIYQELKRFIKFSVCSVIYTNFCMHLLIQKIRGIYSVANAPFESKWYRAERGSKYSKNSIRERCKQITV